MPETYTSAWQFVQDGEATSADPQALVATDSPITVLNAEIQWEGSQTSETTTTTDYSTNTNTATAEATTNTQSQQNADEATAAEVTDTSSNFNDQIGTELIGASFPSSTYANFESHEIVINASISGGSSDTATIYYEDAEGTNKSSTIDGNNDLTFTDTTTNNYEGDSRSVTTDYTGSETVGYDITVKTSSAETNSRTASVTAPNEPSGTNFEYVDVRYYSNGSLASSDRYYSSSYVGQTFSDTSNNTSNTVRVEAQTVGSYTSSDTSCTSYPSVPNGYSFDRHYWREEQNGNKVDSGFVYTNSVGDSRCVTSTDPSNTWTLEVETRGEDETTTTTYYDTHDPAVSGDVSGSYLGTLADGETSTWQALSGLTAGTSNTFEHSIQESHEASFRFRFEWEQVAADPTYGTVGFYDDDAGVYRECAVADPTDTALEYDHVAIYNDAQGAWGVLDLVDPSDDAAITSHQFYDPDVGWLAPREYSTTAP